MEIDVTNHYPTKVEPLVTILADVAFVAARAEAIGHTEFETVSTEGAGAADLVLHYRREAPVTVPAFAAKVLTPRVVVEQRDEWFAPDNATGTRTGTWQVHARGLPIEMQGTMTVEPEGDGCAMRIAGRMQVGIPLIGRRLAKYLVNDTLATIEAERVYTIASLEQGR